MKFGAAFATVCTCFALASSSIASNRTTTLTIQNQSNTQMTVTQSIATSGQFFGPVPSGIGAMGAITIESMNTDAFCGTSGTLVLQPAHASGLVVIQWDNPFIGSNSYKTSGPAGWDVFAIKGDINNDGSGSDAHLTVRIEGKVATTNRPPDVLLATTGAGVVRGRVLWPTSYGAPSQTIARGIGAVQLAAGPWSNFQFGVTQPAKYQPYALAGSLTATYYLGTYGEFLQPVNTGKIAYTALQVPPPGFAGFEFTISDLPISVPISIAVGPEPGVSWQPPKPNTVVTLVGTALKPSFYCVATDVEADLTPKMQSIAGFDFTVNAEWVPSNSPLHNVVRMTAGSSKSTVQFGTVDATTLAAVTAKPKTVLQAPTGRK